MVDLLFKPSYRLLLSIIMAFFVCHSVFAYEMEAYKGNFDLGFGDGYIVKKQQLTPEEKEARRIAKEKLDAKKILMNDENFIIYTKKNNIEVVKLMLEAGMGPDTNYYGEYALYYATRSNKPDMVKLLLNYGAKPNIGFDSALFWAVKKKNPETARLLIEKGAKVNFADLITGNSILYTAIKTNQTELAKELLKCGAKMDLKTSQLIEKKKLKETLGIQPKED